MSFYKPNTSKNSYTLEERPLVTFALFAYNQAEFIREAAESALSQTYTPLQIILSDDCSTDRTFDIMKDIVAAYTGPNEVILNRNNNNIGLGNHVNFMLRVAAGELIVMAAGDDISDKDRVKIVTSKWLERGKPSGIVSSTVIIDQEGKILSDETHCASLSVMKTLTSKQDQIALLATDTRFCLPGCAAAWTKAMWNIYGDLSPSIINEDLILTIRSIISDGVAIIDHPLVKYRHHASNVWSKYKGSKWKMPSDYYDGEVELSRRSGVVRQALSYSLVDLGIARSRNLITMEENETLRRAIERDISKLTIENEWWKMSLLKKIGYVRRLEDRPAVRLLKLLPLKSYSSVRAVVAFLQRIIRKCKR